MPDCGRFISEDPIGWASGSTNNYAYGMGDPVNGTDPSGLTPSAGTGGPTVWYSNQGGPADYSGFGHDKRWWINQLVRLSPFGAGCDGYMAYVSKENRTDHNSSNSSSTSEQAEYDRMVQQFLRRTQGVGHKIELWGPPVIKFSIGMVLFTAGAGWRGSVVTLGATIGGIAYGASNGTCDVF